MRREEDAEPIEAKETNTTTTTPLNVSVSHCPTRALKGLGRIERNSTHRTRPIAPAFGVCDSDRQCVQIRGL